MDITRLAINFSTSFKEVKNTSFLIFLCLISIVQVSTTLVSMGDDVTVIKNVGATLDSLTKHEAHIRDHIMKKYFAPVKQKHWEGIEVEKYKQKLTQCRS